MYNYPGQYAQSPGYPPYPNPQSPSPGIGPPGTIPGAPGASPTTYGAPPSLSNMNNMSLPAKPPGVLPANFQAPPNMAHINFSAPVIRLSSGGTNGPSNNNTTGTGGGSRGNNDQQHGNHMRRGLGMDSGNNRQRDNLIPPTREEVSRTIFIGKIPDGMSDADVEKILRAVGSLRRWTRAYDASSKMCSFGFAEYEDAESLETVIDVLPGVEVPATKVQRDDQGNLPENIESTKLLVQIDDASRKYATEWNEKRGDDESATQSRVDAAKNSLKGAISSLFNPPVNTDGDGDTLMQDSDNKADPVTGEVVTISLTGAAGEDELADIPPAMREAVSAEIASFRDRSNRRDLERLKREEELEAAEKRGGRNHQNSSAPISAPTGPSGRSAPTGPKGSHGNVQNGVNGGISTTSSSSSSYFTPAEEESDASDEELEKRRQAKKQAEEEKAFTDFERKWLNRERARSAAVEREKVRDHDEESHITKKHQSMAHRLKDFNDDNEQSRRSEEFYRDKGAWLRSRATIRAREKDMDDRDRAAEEREKARSERDRDRDRERDHPSEHHTRASTTSATVAAAATREPQRLKISLGAAAQRAQAASGPRRNLAEVEGLLEDEEESETTSKRTLVPISLDAVAAAVAGHDDGSGASTSAPGHLLTDEERRQAARQLAADIPTDKAGLWAWEVRWEFVDEGVLAEQIRPFVEKKIVEYLGVQEEMLVEVVEEHLKRRGSPDELIQELEGPLDEEAEVFVKKLWRMIIFCSESEKRGLSG